MPALEGGKRDRMVSHSLYRLIQSKLGELGWLDDPAITGVEHQQVRVVEGPWPDETAIPPNTVLVYIDDLDYDEMETGSNSEFGVGVAVVDVYGEDHAVGKQLAGDASAILRGQMPSIDRTDAKLDVYDWSLATPSVVAVCDLTRIRTERAKGAIQPWERFWYSVIGTIEDEIWVDLDT